MTTTTTDAPRPWVPRGPQTFGQRLKAVRNELRLTAQEAADACGLKRAAWSNWEKDIYLPQRMSEVVLKISETFGVDRDWLLWGSSASGGPIAPRAGRRMMYPNSVAA